MRSVIHQVILIAVVALAGAGCGGEEVAGAGDAAPSPDASPDAATPGELHELRRRASIALAQETIVGSPEPLSGARVSIDFTDVRTGVAPLPGLDQGLGGCLVHAYDFAAGDLLPVRRDEGSLLVTGTNYEVFGCVFEEARRGYYCHSLIGDNANGSAAGATATVSEDGQAITFAFPANAYAQADSLLGTYVAFSGFTDADGEAPSFDGQLLPVLANQRDSVTVANTIGFAATTDATASDAATYAARIGEAPVPGGFKFLDEGAMLSTTKLDQGDAVGAFTLRTGVNGVGFTLDETSARPDAFPSDAAPVRFACDGAGGVCGTSDAGQINVMRIEGEATNAALDGVAPFSMPAPEAGTRYVTFECTTIYGVGSIELPQAAVEAVLGIAPTRVRVSVGAFAGKILPTTDGVPDEIGQFLGGNMLTGFTDL